MKQNIQAITHKELLTSFSDKELLEELASRNTTLSVLATAGLLYLDKAEDYNSNPDYDLKKYFPFGSLSYAQMIHTKSMRISSIAQKMHSGKEPNFESLFDSALDMICYAMFLGDYCQQEDTPDTSVQPVSLLLS